MRGGEKRVLVPVGVDPELEEIVRRAQKFAHAGAQLRPHADLGQSKEQALLWGKGGTLLIHPPLQGLRQQRLRDFAELCRVHQRVIQVQHETQLAAPVERASTAVSFPHNLKHKRGVAEQLCTDHRQPYKVLRTSHPEIELELNQAPCKESDADS